MLKFLFAVTAVLATVLCETGHSQCWRDAGFVECGSHTNPCEPADEAGECWGSFTQYTGDSADTVAAYEGPFGPSNVNGAALDGSSYEVFCYNITDCVVLYDEARNPIGCGPDIDSVRQSPFADHIGGRLNYDRPCAQDSGEESID